MPYIHLKPLIEEIKKSQHATDEDIALNIIVKLHPTWIAKLLQLFHIRFEVVIQGGRMENDKFVYTSKWDMK